jgi:hypothetical protein
MKHEFTTEAPMLRLACAVAAASITLSIGGFIDSLRWVTPRWRTPSTARL